MKLLKILFLFTISMMLASCSNEETVVEVPEFPTQLEKSNSHSISFKYKEKEYFSEYTVGVDSICFFVNKEVEDLLMKFAQDTTFTFLLKEDGSMVYFDNHTLLLEYIRKEKANQKTTKALPVEAFLSIWNDANGKGYWMGFEATYGSSGNNGRCAYVGDKMNDKISSFELYGAHVVFYEDRDFNGNSFAISGGTDYHYYCPNLTDVRRFEVVNFQLVWVGNWNDRISSFIVYRD